MPHGAGFYTICCANCRQVFELPSLGDMTYGAALLHGERGTMHRYVCVLDHPVWGVIEAVLRPTEPKAFTRWWQVLAAVSDPVGGQRLRIEAVCPHCQADASHFRTLDSPSKMPRVGEVDDAAFTGFIALPDDERRIRILAARHEER